MKFYNLEIIKQLQKRLYDDFSKEVGDEYDEYILTTSKKEFEQRKKVLPLLSNELAELFLSDFIHDSFVKNVTLKRFTNLDKLPEIRMTVYNYNVKGVLTYKDVISYEYVDCFLDKSFRCECLLDELYLNEDKYIVHNIVQHPQGRISITAKSIEWKSLL